MNILILTPHGMYYDYTLSFVHHQAKAFVEAGHRVRVVVPLAAGKRSNEGRRFGPIVEHLEHDGVEMCYVRHLSLSSRGAMHFNPASAGLMCRLFCRDILRDFTPDVVYGHTITFSGRLTPYFQKKYGIPAVLTTHGGDTDVSLRPENRAEAKALCDQADAIVAVSGAYLKKTQQIGTSTRLLRILNGFAVSHLSDAEKIPHRIVQVGALITRKHADVTIQAADRLRREHPDLTLKIVGSGAERGRFEALVAQLGMQDMTEFLGQRTNQESLAEMARAQFFCMPSVLEGFGIVYAEAMASGCLTIGTEGEGIADVIRSGENGFLVPPNDPDAIVRVIDWCIAHPNEAAAIAQRGKEDALSLTWARNAAQYIQLFEELRT